MPHNTRTTFITSYSASLRDVPLSHNPMYLYVCPVYRLLNAIAALGLKTIFCPRFIQILFHTKHHINNRPYLQEWSSLWIYPSFLALCGASHCRTTRDTLQSFRKFISPLNDFTKRLKGGSREFPPADGHLSIFASRVFQSCLGAQINEGGEAAGGTCFRHVWHRKRRWRR